MRNKFTSNLLKKGLISFAAASVLASGVYASSNVASPTSSGGYLDSYVGLYQDAAYDVNISIQELGQAGFNSSGYITFRLPANTTLYGTEEKAGLVIPKSTTYLGTSSSPKDLVVGMLAVDQNLSIKYSESNFSAISQNLLALDDNGTRYLGASTTGYVRLLRYDNLDELNTTGILTTTVGIDDANVTVGKIYLDTSTDETVISLAVASSTTSTDLLNLDFLVYPDANETGDLTVSITDGDADGGNGLSLTDADVTVYEIIDAPAVITYDSTLTDTEKVPNINVADDMSMGDFNITFAYPWRRDGNLTNVDTNVTITLSGAKFSTDTNSSMDGNITAGTGEAVSFNGKITNAVENNISIPSDNVLLIKMTSSIADDNTSLNITGNPTILDASDSSTGTTVTAKIEFNGNIGVKSSGSRTIDTIDIAEIVKDGVELDVNDDASAKAVLVGKTFQSGVDVNITELFISSFANGKTITLELPSGYTWSEKPSVKIGTAAEYIANETDDTAIPWDMQTDIDSDGTNTYTLTFISADDDITVDNTIKVNSDTDEIEILNITGISFDTPDDAVVDSTVSLSLGGTLFSSTVEATPSSIDIATVRGTSAEVTSSNDITSEDSDETLKVGLSATTDSYAKFTVTESYSGTLAVGKTITATLSEGVFYGVTPDDPVRSPTSTAIELDTIAYADDNTTAIWTIKTASTVADGNVVFTLPAIKFSSAEVGVVTATIGGSAGVVGTVDVATVVKGVDVSSGTFTELTAGDIEQYTGEVVFGEFLKDGLAADTSFKVISNDPNVVFTGMYNYATKSSTSSSWGSYQTTAVGSDNNVSTTFNTSDTLVVETHTSSSSIEDIKFKFEVNIRPQADDGAKTMQVKDIDAGIPDSTFELVYIGTVPALAVAETAEVDAGATTTITVTDVVGELTATSDNTDVTVSISGAIITIDASNAATGDTATITVSDDRDEEYTLAVTVNGTTVEPVVGETTADITDLGQTADETKLNVVLKNDGVTQNADGSLNVADKMTVTVTDTGITVEATQEGYTVSNVEVKEGTAPTSRAVVTETEYIQISDDKYLEVTLEKTVADVVGTPALVAGWNLLGNASGSNIDSSTLGGEIVWTFDANPEVLWTQDATIANGAGFWYKATAAGEGLEFTMGNETAKVADNFVAGTWSLLGCGGEKTIADVKAKSELTDSTIVWAYDGSAEQPWSNDDATTVKAGQGYWVK